jgi:hypothetical protein
MTAGAQITYPSRDTAAPQRCEERRGLIKIMATDELGTQ